MICRNCGTNYPDNMSYCPRCKAPAVRQPYNNMQYNRQPVRPPYPAPTPVPAGVPGNMNNNNSNQHKTNIAVIVSVTVIVVAIIIGAILAFSAKTSSNTEIAKYQALLQTHTSDPVVDIQVLDFDLDSTEEAYVITGLETSDGFENGDIWFVDCHDSVHPIKHHVNGKPGNVLYTHDKRPYVTYEIYNSDNSSHNTYVYGVKDSSYYEPAISGNYIDLHLDENDRFVGRTKSGGDFIQFDFNDALEILKSYVAEQNKPAQSSTTKATPATSKAVIEKTTKKQNDNGYLTASDSDFSDFKDFAYAVLDCKDLQNRSEITFNPSSSNACDYAIRSTFNGYGFGVFDFYSKKYGWSSAKQDFYSTGEFDENGRWFFTTPDPLKKLNHSGYYHKIDGQKIDWILKNVFNVSPNHNMVSNDEYHGYYYYNGYYYFSTAGGGGFDLSIISKEQLSDGSYKIKISNPNNSNMYPFEYTFNVALKKVDGNKVWTIFSIS